MDFFTRSDIDSSIRRIDEILATNIFAPKNMGHPFLKSAFIEVLICLRDLMWKVEHYSSRIAFTDDIVATPKVKDISDTIKFVRDALCHPEIEHHFLVPDKIKATFNVVYGKGTLLSVGSVTQSSDYEDDVCFFFGAHKIYLNRHIRRAFEEAKQKLLPLL